VGSVLRPSGTDAAGQEQDGDQCLRCELSDGTYFCWILRGYSSRKATVGSRPAARAAGTQDAAPAISKKSAVIAAKVDGSVALIPTSMAVITRVNANYAEAQTVSDYELEDARRSRAERHPDADLRRPLTYHRREHAVEPHAR
jgi:hypothetical protein